MLAAATVVGAEGSSKALWYLTRGFGLIDLFLLTATVVMGITQVVRYTRPGLPRFVVAALHKNISILAVVFLAIHVVTAVADAYAPISLASVFVPFAGSYRPLWLGLGALSLDLLVALVLTSLIRERLGYRVWRLLHWGAYLCWPVAVLHGLGTGTDTKLGWVLALNGLCVAAVLVAICWRVARGWAPSNAARRGLALVGSFVLLISAGVWTVSGPLHPGWAKRAGTPAALLGGGAAAGTVPSDARTTSSTPARSDEPAFDPPFSSPFTGTQHEERVRQDGTVSVRLQGTFSEGAFTVVLSGRPLDDGGVRLTGSEVAVGPSKSSSRYQGHVTELDGEILVAALRDTSNHPITVTIQLSSSDGEIIGGTIEVTR